MRLANLAAFVQMREIARGGGRARVGARVHDACIEGAGASAQGVERQTPPQHRRCPPATSASRNARLNSASIPCVPFSSDKPSFASSATGVIPARRMRVAAGQNFALIRRAPFADHHLRQMRERREIAGSSDRALRRNHRVHSGVEHRAERFDGLRADAAEAFGQRIGAQQHHRARFRFAQRRADAASVRAHEIHLKLAHLFGRDAHRRELAEAGVDAVGGFARGDDAIDDRARSLHAFDRVGRQRDFLAAKRDVVQLREGQIVAGEFNGMAAKLEPRHASLRSGLGTFRLPQDVAIFLRQALSAGRCCRR